MKVSFIREVLVVYARRMEDNAEAVSEAGDSFAINQVAADFVRQAKNARVAFAELEGLDDAEELVPASAQRSDVPVNSHDAMWRIIASAYEHGPVDVADLPKGKVWENGFLRAVHGGLVELDDQEDVRITDKGRKALGVN